jgi:hypothetical protein
LSELDRKENTRKKIQLGGLIIKAGLDDEKAATLYGLLLEAKETLSQGGESIRAKWQLKGEIAFKET